MKAVTEGDDMMSRAVPVTMPLHQTIDSMPLPHDRFHVCGEGNVNAAIVTLRMMRAPHV